MRNLFLKLTRRAKDERGESASYMVLAGGLCLAVIFAMPTFQGVITRLAQQVGGGDGTTLTGPPSGSPFDPPVAADPVFTDPESSQEDADEALEQITDILNKGDDDKVTEEEMEDIHDWLETLTDEELAYVFANMSDEEIQRLFGGIDHEGWLPWHGWSDEEKAAFYETIAPVTNDPEALLRIENALPTEDFLDFLVAADTDHSDGRWPNGEAVDALILASIDGDYLEGALDDGHQTQGTLAIVDHHNYELAFDAYNAQRNPPLDPDTWEGWNGFVDHEGRQWVKIPGANPGTPLHESVHGYSDDALKDEVSQPLNEGVTEYFTRQVVANTDDPATDIDEAAKTQAGRNGIYRDNTAFASDLVDLVGEDVVAAAYFDGDIDGLQDAYLEATGRPESDWDLMLEHLINRTTTTDPVTGDESTDRDPEWDDATDLLTELPE